MPRRRHLPFAFGIDADRTATGTNDRSFSDARISSKNPAGRTQTFAVDHRGERLGALRVTCSAGEPLTPAGERLVRDVAAQAGWCCGT
jgi:hypothetical protein